ncbi:hypothetical protein B0H19DRAFT_1224571 [Mycena capillaripes]|nr:hypothetical protein B0H19DRAFT_1224571 [Mycena capillaripes]
MTSSVRLCFILFNHLALPPGAPPGGYSAQHGCSGYGPLPGGPAPQGSSLYRSTSYRFNGGYGARLSVRTVQTRGISVGCETGSPRSMRIDWARSLRMSSPALINSDWTRAFPAQSFPPRCSLRPRQRQAAHDHL